MPLRIVAQSDHWAHNLVFILGAPEICCPDWPLNIQADFFVMSLRVIVCNCTWDLLATLPTERTSRFYWIASDICCPQWPLSIKAGFFEMLLRFVAHTDHWTYKQILLKYCWDLSPTLTTEHKSRFNLKCFWHFLPRLTTEHISRFYWNAFENCCPEWPLST